MPLVPLLLLLTGIVCCLFLIPPAWFPAAISAAAVRHDAQFTRTLWITGAIFVSAQLLLAYAIWRRRAAPPPHRWMELAVTAAISALFLGLAVTADRTWATVQLTSAPKDAEIIEVYARQFAWTFRYPGPDGKFGRTSIRLINDAGGNPLGLDEHDPAALDDVVSATLKAPLGREVSLVLRSRDVIHDFFVRELRLKQDIVPGMDIPLRFRAEKAGVYEIACAELCGLGHHQMHSTLEVLTPADYERWLRARLR